MRLKLYQKKFMYQILRNKFENDNINLFKVLLAKVLIFFHSQKLKVEEMYIFSLHNLHKIRKCVQFYPQNIAIFPTL